MTPFSKGAKVAFLIVLALTIALVVLSVAASVWSQMGEDGWVTKAAIAVLCWMVTVPFVLAIAIWETILLATRTRRSTGTSDIAQRDGDRTPPPSR